LKTKEPLQEGDHFVYAVFETSTRKREEKKTSNINIVFNRPEIKTRFYNPFFFSFAFCYFVP
jgi:hypothetical protein